MNTNKNACEVATHFNKTFHVLSDFNFTIIEQSSNLSDNNSLDDPYSNKNNKNIQVGK